MLENTDIHTVNALTRNVYIHMERLSLKGKPMEKKGFDQHEIWQLKIHKTKSQKPVNALRIYMNTREKEKDTFLYVYIESFIKDCIKNTHSRFINKTFLRKWASSATTRTHQKICIHFVLPLINSRNQLELFAYGRLMF